MMVTSKTEGDEEGEWTNMHDMIGFETAVPAF
jgi:hypothetical protein